MNEEETKDKIIQLLKQQGKMFIKDIAKKLTISSATVSKYLGILNAEGKVSKSEQRPYTFWQLKDKWYMISSTIPMTLEILWLWGYGGSQ